MFDLSPLHFFYKTFVRKTKTLDLKATRSKLVSDLDSCNFARRNTSLRSCLHYNVYEVITGFHLNDKINALDVVVSSLTWKNSSDRYIHVAVWSGCQVQSCYTFSHCLWAYIFTCAFVYTNYLQLINVNRFKLHLIRLYIYFLRRWINTRIFQVSSYQTVYLLFYDNEWKYIHTLS